MSEVVVLGRVVVELVVVEGIRVVGVVRFSTDFRSDST